MALPLPERVARTLWDCLAALRSGEGARWVARENLHLTLFFLGQTDPANVEDVVARMRGVADRAAAFPIELGGAGSFGRGDRPRVLWLGLRRGGPEAAAIGDALAPELLPFSEEPESEMPAGGRRPHLTLARRAPRALVKRVDGAVADGQPLEWRAEAICLFRSRLGRDGPAYELLAEATLGASTTRTIGAT